jgi:hypothetical protein
LFGNAELGLGRCALYSTLTTFLKTPRVAIAATSSQNKKSDKQKIDVQSLYLSGGGVLSDTVIGIL